MAIVTLRSAERLPEGLHGNVKDMGNLTVPTTLDGLLEPLSRCFDAESASLAMARRVRHIAA